MIAANWRSSPTCRPSAYGKPWVLLPAPVSGRFQHHCAGFNRELGHLDPKDIEGQEGRRAHLCADHRAVDSRHPAARIWRRSRQGHLHDRRRGAPRGIHRSGQLRAAAQRLRHRPDDAGRRAGGNLARHRSAQGPQGRAAGPRSVQRRQGLVRARGRGADQPHLRGPPGYREKPPRRGARTLPHDRRKPRPDRRRPARSVPADGARGQPQGHANWRSTGPSNRRSSRAS